MILIKSEIHEKSKQKKCQKIITSDISPTKAPTKSMRWGTIRGHVWKNVPPHKKILRKQTKGSNLEHQFFLDETP